MSSGIGFEQQLLLSVGHLRDAYSHDLSAGTMSRVQALEMTLWLTPNCTGTCLWFWRSRSIPTALARSWTSKRRLSGIRSILQ